MKLSCCCLYTMPLPWYTAPLTSTPTHPHKRPRPLPPTHTHARPQWNVSVSSNDTFEWTAPITSVVRLANLSDVDGKVWAGGVWDGTPLGKNADPLAPRSLFSCSKVPCSLPYGGPYAVVGRGVPGETWSPALALPVVSVLSRAAGLGLSLVQSPETVAVGANLVVGGDGPTPSPPPAPPPSPPALSLQDCNKSDPRQRWSYDSSGKHRVASGNPAHAGACVALVKAPPYPAILWPCAEIGSPAAAAATAAAASLRDDQLWRLSPQGELLMEGFFPNGARTKPWCLTFDRLALDSAVRLENCATGAAEQEWSFSTTVDTVTGSTLLRNGIGSCLSTQSDADADADRPSVAANTGANSGVLNYTRVYHRLGNRTAPATFSQRLLLHAADWRPAVGHMVETWPAWFRPNDAVNITAMEGAGGYADYRGGDLGGRAAKLREMNFGLNWDAVFPYPYHGMWMPYSPLYNATWENCFTHPSYDKQPAIFNTNTSWIEAYVQQLGDLGFSTCMYANLFEFGWNVTDGAAMPGDCANSRSEDPFEACHENSRCRSNEILRDEFADAVIRDWVTGGLVQPKGCLGTPCAMMDPGTTSYLRHLVAMTQAVVDNVPSARGLCIDRQDMVGRLNPRADDGVTWFESTSQNLSGGRARNTVFSMIAATEAMAKVLRPGQKGIFVNVHTSRLDMMRHVDGIFDEHGDNPVNMPLSGLLGVAMPVVIWNHGTLSGLDEFLQAHLFYGVNFMAPVPNNDHSIHSDAGDASFLAYGPLFATLRSKLWVLVPDAVIVIDNTARANLFKVASGFIGAVVMGGANATVVLRGVELDAGGNVGAVRLMHPGGAVTDAKATVAIVDGWREVTVTAPLVRGCALVMIAA